MKSRAAWLAAAVWVIVMAFWTAGCQGTVKPTAEAGLRPSLTPSPTSTFTATPRPTATVTPSPTPTITPSPTPTPLPTPTLPAGAVGFEDPANDGIYCTTGRPALFLLPPELDLFYAAMQRVEREGKCFLAVSIWFRKPVGETRFRGGVLFVHQSLPMLAHPSRTWYFDNVGSLSFNFEWKGEGTQPLRLWVDRVQGGGWKVTVVPGYTGYVTEHGVLVLEMPCRAVPEGARWMVGVADQWGKKCDALGLRQDRASLPLPP